MPNVFITGASSGIGEALAREFARRGAVLGLVARRREKLDELIDTLPGGCERHHAFAADVTKRDEIIAAAREFERLTGGADIVIANAGISHGVKTEFYEDLDVLEAVYRTNVFAMANTFHPFIAPMKARGTGQLVGIGSVAGIRGLPGSEAYCASKSAVITYCESLRVELGKVGIRVTTICPGFVRTPLTAKNPYKMPFLQTPDEFARDAVKAILARTSYAVIPWQMGVLAKVLRLLPNWLFDRILAKRKQKPRISPKDL
ncbi:SDR family oxidoreductase [Sutterella megalosphaeroides]|uniref:Short-chain dehydrogenase n=1 Tax=Sutterella megalosphaeroides TaxID=2494234 RepID=A0A2Z6I9V1_9BURK|nr:SDR family oxidoreductase [Sutterella megalosphaeroides]BBF22377.1 short-chain dehydrogenase [Sutterella megalosphaeroides]